MTSSKPQEPASPKPSPPDGSSAVTISATRSSPLTIRTYPFARPSAEESAPGGRGATRPFARSARKRESVLALGSIDHLAHQFTKLSRAHAAELCEEKRTRPDGRGKGPSTWVVDEEDEDRVESEARSRRPVEPLLPPTPAKPRASGRGLPNRPAGAERAEPDWKGTMRALRALERTCSLNEAVEEPMEAETPVDMLELIQTTTAGIKAVRLLALAVPDNHLPGFTARRASSAAISSAVRPLLAPTRNFSTPSRPVFSNSQQQPARPVTMAMTRSLSGGGSSTVNRGETALDPLARIRRATLDVLAALRTAEETLRLESPEGDGIGPRELASDSDGSDVPPSIPSASSLPDSPTTSAPLSWEDRLDYSYPSGLTITRSPPLSAVQHEVRLFLREVDEVLFGGRGWDGRSEDWLTEGAGAGSNQSGLVEPPDDIENGSVVWADKNASVAARIHALFTALFPSDVLSNVFGDGLATLTDGQLLCEAFNAMVRRSSQPFPLIPLDRIHDILGEAEQKESPSRQTARETSSQPRHQRSPGRNESADGSEAAGRRRRTYLFRRIENLREFAAAVKIRYLVPLIPPNSPSPPLGSIVFSAPFVAKQEDGWEPMLEGILRCWLDRLTDERSDEREQADRRVGG